MQKQLYFSFLLLYRQISNAYPALYACPKLFLGVKAFGDLTWVRFESATEIEREFNRTRATDEHWSLYSGL